MPDLESEDWGSNPDLPALFQFLPNEESLWMRIADFSGFFKVLENICMLSQENILEN